MKFEVKAVAFMVGLFGVMHLIEALDPVSPVETASATSTQETWSAAPVEPTKVHAPDYAEMAATNLQWALSWDVFDATCKPINDAGGWFVACRYNDDARLFALYAASASYNDDSYQLIAITGKSKEFAERGSKMRKLPIDTTQYVTGLNIDRVMSKFDE